MDSIGLTLPGQIAPGAGEPYNSARYDDSIWSDIYTLSRAQEKFMTFGDEPANRLRGFQPQSHRGAERPNDGFFIPSIAGLSLRLRDSAVNDESHSWRGLRSFRPSS